jgi:UDP:flavonoid glycosyltransferase YjiC (YdhE family)
VAVLPIPEACPRNQQFNGLPSGRPFAFSGLCHAFEIPVPPVLFGTCAAGTIPVYRLWDGRADADHRYTTDRNVRQQMIEAGYISEGFGPERVFFCAIGA